MTTQIKETSGAAAPAAPGRIKLQLISPGWGSSGYYSQPVLESAGRDKVWPSGTHVFFDHPSESEAFDRPERSVRDLAAILDEDAHWDATEGALVATARVIGPYRELVTDPVFVEAVGMSIRASAEARAGEADGRKGPIVTRFVEGLSVDLVTRAGRGGKVLAVLESARIEARETLSQETRAILQVAVEDVAGEDAYVIDFDPDAGNVIYRQSFDDGSSYHSELYRDGYTVTDGMATLAGSPVEVRSSTSYVDVPADAGDLTEAATNTVPAPAGRTTPSPRSQEDNMGNIQVEETRFASLTEAAGRVPTLESERDAATARATAAEAALARRGILDDATTVITTEAATAGVAFSQLEMRGLLADLPMADGSLNQAAFSEAVRTAAASKAQEAGAGRPHGFGSTAAPDTDTVSAVEAQQAIDRIYGRTVKEA